MKLGFIGAGRAGSGLALALAHAGWPAAAIASRRPAAAAALAARIPSCRVASAQEVVDSADLVFLAVSDDAIEPVARSLRWRSGAAVVHCSGATELEALGKPAAEGALVGGFHPLHMFGPPGEREESLAGCAIALAGPPELIARLQQLARALGAQALVLPQGSRALYHASANFVAAFVIALLSEAVGLWRRLGVEEGEAVAALLPLLRGTVENIAALGPAAGLGSAIARGDVGTLRRHLAALAERAPESLELYRMLSLRTLPLACAQGLSPALAAQIEALLNAPQAESALSGR